MLQKIKSGKAGGIIHINQNITNLSLKHGIRPVFSFIIIGTYLGYDLYLTWLCLVCNSSYLSFILRPSYIF